MHSFLRLLFLPFISGFVQLEDPKFVTQVVLVLDREDTKESKRMNVTWK